MLSDTTAIATKLRITGIDHPSKMEVLATKKLPEKPTVPDFTYPSKGVRIENKVTVLSLTTGPIQVEVTR